LIVARYLSRNIAMAIAFVLLALVLLFGFFELIEEQKSIGSGAYKFQHAILYVLLNFPGRAYEVMPIAVLIGAIYAFAQFASNSEFTAMRAAGLGRTEALRSLVVLGLSLVAITFVIGEIVTPPLERLAKQVKGRSGDSGAVKLRSGAWIKDSARDDNGQPTAQRFINVVNLNPDGSLSQVSVFEFDLKFRLVEILSAVSGQYMKEAGWQLNKVQRNRYQEAVTPDSEQTLVSSSEQFDKLNWKSDLTPELFGVLAIDPERMSAFRLWQYIEHLKDNQQRSDRYEIAMWKKIIYPFVNLVMLVLALPFAYLQARSGGIGYKVSAGVMLGVTFHFLNGLFSHVGMLNTWPAWIAAATPSMIATALALFLLYWVDRA
jgi:lipopolysaccharide export system permease protein